MTPPVFPTDEQLQHAQIPRPYWRTQLLDIDGEDRFLDLTQRYVENIRDMCRFGVGLLIAGKPLIPPQQAASLIARAALREKLRVFYVEANELQRAVIRNEFSSRNEYGDPVSTIEHAESVDLLWLNGLGLEYVKSADESFAKNVVTNLLYTRFIHQKSTIVVSPLSLLDIGTRYEVVLDPMREAKKLFAYSAGAFDASR